MVQTVDDINGWEPLLAEKVRLARMAVPTRLPAERVRFYPSGNEMTVIGTIAGRQLSDRSSGQFENSEAASRRRCHQSDRRLYGADYPDEINPDRYPSYCLNVSF